MPKMLPKPHSRSHYDYVNELLDLPDDKKISPKKPIHDEDELKRLLEEQLKTLKAGEQPHSEETAGNISKIERARDTLMDEKSRANYDEALTSEKLDLRIKQLQEQGYHNTMVALAPISEIKKEFEQFKSEQLALKDEKGNPLYKDEDFKFETDPDGTTWITSPDKDEFMDRLLDKNMAMYPGGSQDRKHPGNINQLPRKAMAAVPLPQKMPRLMPSLMLSQLPRPPSLRNRIPKAS